MKPVKNTRHFVSVSDLGHDEMLQLFIAAQKIKEWFEESEQNRFRHLLDGYSMASLFYEPSTRTRFSFEMAMKHLGGWVVETEAAGMFSSATKGETIEDTIRVIAGYHADVVVLRHGTKGSAKKASALDCCSAINAGDGDGEHPTQALLDWFTIWESFQYCDLSTLHLVGDLLHGRTVHSLIEMACILRESELGLVDKIVLSSPECLALPDTYYRMMDDAGIKHRSFGGDLNPVAFTGNDILYVTRAQIERMDDQAAAHETYVVTPELMHHMKSDGIVMHPLPRVDELPTEIDSMPQARYFEQAENGLYVRMALLLWIHGKMDLVL